MKRTIGIIVLMTDARLRIIRKKTVTLSTTLRMVIAFAEKLRLTLTYGRRVGKAMKRTTGMIVQLTDARLRIIRKKTVTLSTTLRMVIAFAEKLRPILTYGRRVGKAMKRTTGIIVRLTDARLRKICKKTVTLNTTLRMVIAFAEKKTLSLLPKDLNMPLSAVKYL